MALMFYNVTWNTNEPLTGYKLDKMVANDNLNYSLVNKSPKGQLANLDIASITQSNRTLNLTTTDGSGNPTYKTLGSFYVYNKSNVINKRYYKLCVSDITINDTNLSEATSGIPPHKNFIMLFKIIHPLNLEVLLQTEWCSNFRPVRSASPYSTNFWRSQPFEFLFSPMFEETFIEDFLVEVQIRKRVASHNTFTLISGNIWAEDAGANLSD
jgi:hypothetical protein